MEEELSKEMCVFDKKTYLNHFFPKVNLFHYYFIKKVKLVFIEVEQPDNLN